MNPEWSGQNKAVQLQLKKATTFPQGIETLLALRQVLMDELLRMKEKLNRAEFSAMPFPNANGYHSKTIAYSIWHIFRIEDIVAHDLICRDEEIFARFRDKIGAPLITTGNELIGRQIKDFSESLALDALYEYALAVKENTDALLRQFTYRDLQRKYDDTDKERLRGLQVVSTDENACWLIDYWCGKDIRGLIQMPFSRHWIMHMEASLRIGNKIHVENSGRNYEESHDRTTGM